MFQEEEDEVGTRVAGTRPFRVAPGHHHVGLPSEQTARLSQQMELMMRNKRDHFTVVLGKPQRALGHLNDRASQSLGVRYGKLLWRWKSEQRLPGPPSAPLMSLTEPVRHFLKGKYEKWKTRASANLFFILFYEPCQQEIPCFLKTHEFMANVQFDVLVGALRNKRLEDSNVLIQHFKKLSNKLKNQQ